ncbi:uncharacterized protein LOC144138882 [Haemaphysalis longicornis]
MGARKRHTPVQLNQQPVRLRGEFFEEDDDGHEGSTPAMVSPFFFFPPRLAGLPERPFQSGPYGPIIDGRGGFNPFFFKKVVSVPHEETARGERADAAAYSRSPLRVRDPLYTAGQGGGEPHQRLPKDDTFGANLMDPVTFERSVWQSLQEMYNGPVVTNYGTISVILRSNMRVDITVEGAIRLVNFEKHCTAAINCFGDKSCICHPCGRVFQERMNVSMATGTRLAKISRRGVTFTALNHGLVYLVDASGTKSTTERFLNLSYDVPLCVFYYNSGRGMDIFEDCFELISQAKRRHTRNGDTIWVVGCVNIKQSRWGDVEVACDSGRRVITSSPSAGNMFVMTPFIKCSVTCDPNKYFFVRTGKKRLSGSADGFSVTNGSQRAGFDRLGRLTLP